MASIIGALRVVLGLDSADFDAGVSRVEAGANRAGAAMQRMDAPVRKAGSGLGGLGGSLSNTSFQLQDLVVQIQSGTSATVALSQQLPQLLGGFGAFGAVLGLVAGLSVPLIAKMVDFSTVAAEAEQSLGRLLAILPSLGGGFNALGEVFTAIAANLDRIAIYGATAAAIFAGKYVAGLVAAAVATGGLSAALLVLRGALIRTGIGAIVVLAGELVYQFTQLQRGAGGFGNAMGLLGNVVSEVLSRIGRGFDYVAGMAQSAVARMQEYFLRGFARIASAFGDVIDFIADGLNSLFDLGLTGASRFAEQQLVATANAAGASAEASAAAARAAGEAMTAPLASLEALRTSVAEGAEQFNAAGEAADLFGGSLAGGGGGSGGGGGGVAGAAAAAADKLAGVESALESILASQSQATRETIAFRAALHEAGMEAEELGEAKAQIVIGGIDGIANAFGDFIAGGLRDFKGFARSILDSFKSMLSQMIAMAAKNRIMISMGFGGVPGGAMAGGMGAAAGGGMGAGGILGSIGGAIGTLGSSFMAGASGFMTNLLGLNGAAGGIGGAMGFAGSALGQATTGLAGFGTALGAIAIPLAAVGLAFMAFRKKVTVLDQGIRVTVKGYDALIDTFKKTKTSRLFGLVSNTGTKFKDAAPDVADPIEDAYRDVFDSVSDMAGQLGLGADALKNFSYQFKLSLKGMTEEQQQAALTAEFQKVADAMAKTAGVTAQFIRTGETASQALQRMSTSLTAVNAAMTTLGFGLYDVSLAGADAASKFVDLFGTLDNFATATSYYFENFYSISERAQEAARQFQTGLQDLGVTFIPETTEAFRGLVDSLMEENRTQQAAGLIQLAPLFQQMLGLRGQSTGGSGSAGDIARGISADGYSTRFDHQWAQASAVQQAIRPAMTEDGRQLVAAMGRLEAEQKRQAERQEQIDVQIAINTRQTARILQEQNTVGLPPVRS